MPRSGIDDMFSSLPLPGKVMVTLWTYLVASGWYSTYMLLSLIGAAWSDRMFGALENTFWWIVLVIFIASLFVIGMLFYGRYKRKEKDEIKTAIANYEETGEYISPSMKFDFAIVPFWIGGSFLNTMASITVLYLAIDITGLVLDPEFLYVALGFVIAFFLAVLSYMVSELFANGVLDGKWIKSTVSTIIGSPELKALVKTFTTKANIPESCVDAIYEKVKGAISAKEYKDLTPDEVLLLNKAISELEKESQNQNQSCEQPMEVS